MRNRLFLASVAALATLATAMPAEARINQRQDRQQTRIGKGIINNSLTARETVRLGKQQVRVDRYEARSRADGGGLNFNERARIETMQDRASRNIYRQKHDAQTR